MANILPSAPPEMTDQQLYDTRVTNDMSALRFEDVEKSGQDDWIVIKIMAGQFSGSGTIVGAAIEAETGRMIEASTGSLLTAPAGQMGIVEAGSWQLVSAVGNYTGTRAGEYTWIEPVQSRIKGLEPQHLYRPFAKGGTVLCRHNRGLSDIGEFNPVYLLPSGWESAVRPAYESYQQHPELFAGPSLRSQPDGLVQLLHSDNPLVSTHAFRAMLENGLLSTQLLEDALGRSAGYQRAILVYLLLLHPEQIDEAELTRKLTELVDGARTAQELRPIAIGTVTLSLLHRHLPTSQRLAPRFLGTLSNRSLALGGGQHADAYLDRVFNVMRVT
jgi:hypothetical protein